MEGQETAVQQILEGLSTLHEASLYLFQKMQQGNFALLEQTTKDMFILLYKIESLSGSVAKEIEEVTLPLACQSLRATILEIQKKKNGNLQGCVAKMQFEFLPLVEEAYLHFYFWAWVHPEPARLQKYYEDERIELCRNVYLDEALKTGRYKYDMAFVILAYNKLEYTKQCVENLLKNIPEGLLYELILVNHGSTDGTKQYFESINPTKQLDIAVNGGGWEAYQRIIESEFMMLITNDVIVTKNAIQNMLTCIHSDETIAWVVPAAPNVSNLQTIPADYNTLGDLPHFAETNNVSDPTRWEQRVRLCNPIDLRRSAAFYSSVGILDGGYVSAASVWAFPDDRISVLLRRNGYQMRLVKDAYCHHFGSVTLKDEIAQKKEQMVYQQGRKNFQEVFGIDPWGTGFCYDPIFQNRVIGEVTGPVRVLGINCGMGSNSLKIKEQIKEYGQRFDSFLYNITDDKRWIQDLNGVSDTVQYIDSGHGFQEFMKGEKWDYIVWEVPFLKKNSFSALYSLCEETLVSGGRFFIKETEQNRAFLQRQKSRKNLGNNWIQIQKP